MEPGPDLSLKMGKLLLKRIGVCGTDLHAYQGTQPFFNYPRILGHELSGLLVDFDGPQDFIGGEAVTFLPYFSCGECVLQGRKLNCCNQIQVCGVHVDGGMTEYISVPSSCLVHGGGLSYDELALAEPLAIGTHGVKRADIKPGEFVLVIGAGPIGLGTMEFVRIASGITIALDVNGHRLDFCKRYLDVQHTINAVTENVTERLMKSQW